MEYKEQSNNWSSKYYLEDFESPFECQLSNFEINNNQGQVYNVNQH